MNSLAMGVPFGICDLRMWLGGGLVAGCCLFAWDDCIFLMLWSWKWLWAALFVVLFPGLATGTCMEGCGSNCGPEKGVVVV